MDSDGSGSFDRVERWVYDGDDVLLDFVDPDGSGPAALALATRYLHGPAVDQVLAQEDVASGEVLWQLADNQGTVRDVVDSDGAVATHLAFEAFRTLTAGDASATRYLFTGRAWDADLGLYYYRARWYDQETGRFLSEDPIGFEAGDANLSRYVGNDPANLVDPDGLRSWNPFVWFGTWLGGSLGDAKRGMELDRRIFELKGERDSREGGGQFREAQLYGAETAINDASMFAEGCIEFTAGGGAFVGPSAAARGIAVRAGSATSKAARGTTKGSKPPPNPKGGGIRAQGSSTLRDLGLGDVDLAGKSYNSARKALEKAGFSLDRITSTGRRVFRNPQTGAEVYYDCGKALGPGQKPHWHIRDRSGQAYGRSGRPVDSADRAGHIPAG